MFSVCPVFEDAYDIWSFNKEDRRKIMLITWCYLLGTNDYKESYKPLREYWLHLIFSKTLKSLSDKKIYHVIDNIRPYVKSNGKTKSRLISDEDKKWLDDLTFCRWRIKQLDSYPKLEYVIDNVKLRIWNFASSLVENSFKNDNMTGINDIVTELQMKVAQTYKLYIYNYGQRNWNDRVFFSCIQRGINSRGIDLNKDKKRKHVPTVPLHEEFYDSDNYDSVDNGSWLGQDYSLSLEDMMILQGK